MAEEIFSLDFVLHATGGKLVNQGKAQGFSAVGTDSRKDLSGQLFVALKGDVFDAHDFLASASTSGAAGVLVHQGEKLSELPSHVSQILVADTLVALQQLAQAWRRKLNPFLLAVTGSNGKTSTKEFLHQILSQSFSTLKSQGSFNNHWGVPLTLLNLRAEHTHGVIEMGMNHAGEIKQLVRIAEPQVVACTNVGKAHMGNFASREDLAKAKEEIYGPQKGLKIKVFNLDNPFTSAMKDRYVSDQKILTFSQSDARADVMLQVKTCDAGGLDLTGHILGRKGEVRVPVFGKHHAENLACAATMALACGLSSDQIWQELAKCRTTWGRGEWIETKWGCKVLFDAYNANPDSFGALFENLKDLPRPQGSKWWLIASDMLEMGEEAQEQHRELGQRLNQLPWEGVFYLGEWAGQIQQQLKNVSFWSRREWDASAFEAALKEKIAPGDLVVVKGSRGGGLERAVKLLGPLNWGSKDSSQ